MSSSFEEDFLKSQFNSDDEFENTQSLRPGKNLNPDSSLNPNHPFAKSEQSSFPKAQFTSIGGSSLLMRAAMNHPQKTDSSLTSTEHIISQQNSNTTQETSQTQKPDRSGKILTLNQETVAVEQRSGEPGISLKPAIDFAVVGTTVTYSFNKGKDLAPSYFYHYRWEVHNDQAALERYYRSHGFLKHLVFGPKETIQGPWNQSFEFTWDLVGKHRVICYGYTYGKLTDTFEYVQEVRSPADNADLQFSEKAASALQPDVYQAQLELRKEILEQEDPLQNADKIKQLDAVIANVSEKLGVSEKEPLGNSIPLKAILVPKDIPDSNVPLQLYLRRVGSQEQWEIVDLTNPAPDAARTYSGTPDSNLLPSGRARDAIENAWQNFLENTPNPAGQIVAELPVELSEKVGFEGQQRWNGYSNGMSEWQKVREWFSNIGLLAGLGAIFLTVAPIPGSRVVAVGLFLTAGAASAGAGALNLADKLEHGNFQWNGETYLDLLDIVAGLAAGTQAGILLRGNAAKITQLRSAILISESVETGSDLTGGVIISGMHYRRIEEIRQTVTDENKRKQLILEELRNAAATGGLILLGMSGVGGGKKGKGDELAPDSSSTPKIESPGTRPDLSTPSPSSVKTVIDSLRSQYSTSTFVNNNGLVAINNQIDIHPEMIQKLASEDLNKIVTASKELENVGGDFDKLSKETPQLVQNLSKSGGLRLRFDYQIIGQVYKYLEYMGIKNNELFQNLSRNERVRLFDIPNSMNYLEDYLPGSVKQSTINKQLKEKYSNLRDVEYALAQNPKNPYEFINHIEFYRAYLDNKIVTLNQQYLFNLNQRIKAEATNLGITVNVIKEDTAKLKSINQQVSKEFFLNFDGNSKALDTEQAVRKEIKRRVEESAVTPGLPDKINPSILNETQENYKQKVKETENLIGTISIDANLSPEETAQRLKNIADELKFSSESAATYHALKHYKEQPPSHVGRYSTKFEDYYQSAIETIKKSTEIIPGYNQNGDRTFKFISSYSDLDYKLQVIVSVSPQGEGRILTYFQFK